MALKDQDDLLEQLKLLRAEKELLEKHVFVLNECLSVEELKIKIADIEKKKEMLTSLEKLIEKLRKEIEPLTFLKSILNKKLTDENETNIKELKSFIDLNSNTPKVDKDFSQTSKVNEDFSQISEVNTSLPLQSLQTINNMAKTDSFPKQKISYDELSMTNQTQNPNKSYSVSSVNDNSIDEYMQLLDQYDIVTVQEVLNVPEDDLPSEITSIELEPSTSITNNIDLEVQNEQTVTTSTYVDTERKIEQLKNEENILSVKSDTESSVDNSNGQLHEASTSELLKTQEELNLDLNNSITHLLLKMPQLLLKQENEVSEVEDKSNQSSKNTLLKTYIEHNETLNNKDTLNTSKKETTENIEPTELSECCELFNSNHPEISVKNFNDMNLNIDILRGIYSLGFINATVLQRRVIVHCINGRDVIVFAGLGNGRTLMFTIALLQRIKFESNKCQALVLVPNVDLAKQIQKVILSVGDYLSVRVNIVGESNPSSNFSIVPHVVVGTPGAVAKMIAHGTIRTGYIHTVVVKEVENMLTPNYTKSIKEVIAKVPMDKQVTLLTSDKLDHVLDMYMETLRDPLVIIDDKDNKIEIFNNLPKQFYLNIQEEWKMNALCEIFETLKIKKVIIFCNTLSKLENLYQSLARLQYRVLRFHYEMTAYKRLVNLGLFSSGDVPILITTDPIGGSQFHEAAWIINYDLPLKPTNYLNRIAKCAKHIKVLNLINENDDSSKSAIEAYNNSFMIQMPLNMVDLLQY